MKAYEFTTTAIGGKGSRGGAFVRGAAPLQPQHQWVGHTGGGDVASALARGGGEDLKPRPAYQQSQKYHQEDTEV